MVFKYSNNPFHESILNFNVGGSEVPFMVMYSLNYIYNLISMVNYVCGFTVYCPFSCLHGFLSNNQVVYNTCNMGTRGLPDIYTLRLVALVLWVYISGKPLMPMLQLYNV